jgi:hypothetical protein
VITPVVERDVLPDDAANRRGVPQGRHLHALLARGSRALEELFPGLLDELVNRRRSVFRRTRFVEGLLQPGRTPSGKDRFGRVV